MEQKEFMIYRQMFLTNKNNVKAANKLYNELTRIATKILYGKGLMSNDIEDIAAKAVSDAIINIAKYEPRFSYKTWFGTIVNNKYKDFCRKQSRRGGWDNYGFANNFSNCDNSYLRFEAADESNAADESMDMSIQRAELKEMIDNIECEKARTIMILHTYEELSNTEIINITGYGKSYVAQVIHRFKNGYFLRDAA